MSAIVPRLELRQAQGLVMTQQLQQSIKLLQLSSLELMEFVEQELEKNPLLSADEPEPAVENPADDVGDAVASEAPDAKLPDADAPEAARTERDAEAAEGAGDYESFEEYTPRITSSGGGDEDGFTFESILAEEVTLREHLLRQLRLEAASPAERLIGQHLIDLVDEAGYIKEDVSGIAALLGCDASLIDAAFERLHTFDPPGVCARTLAECLSIQLRDKDRLDPAMAQLIQHLGMVAKGELQALGRICGVDAEDIAEMCAEIRRLNPRPGIGFQHEIVQAVIPDVFLRPTKQNGWQVELNTSLLPRVLVNRRYFTQLSHKALGKEDKKYLSEQLTSANWLVKALDSRAQTILKVSSEIVTQQDAFFREGIRYLRPLTLKEVASAVGMHESTVSRVTTAKYMASPRGTFELKYFFGPSLQNASGGNDYSNKTVQHLIKELIRAESPDAILSDDTIAANLNARGVHIARRTVAKYREAMQIPASSVRKREKPVLR